MYYPPLENKIKPLVKGCSTKPSQPSTFPYKFPPLFPPWFPSEFHSLTTYTEQCLPLELTLRKYMCCVRDTRRKWRELKRKDVETEKGPLRKRNKTVLHLGGKRKSIRAWRKGRPRAVHPKYVRDGLILSWACRNPTNRPNCSPSY